MTTITTHDMSARLPDLLTRLAAGEEVLVTDHGRAVARLLPAEPAAVERFALAGYRDGTLSRYQVQRMLGFDNRWDAEEWLGSRGAAVQYTTADLDQDRAALDRVLGR